MPEAEPFYSLSALHSSRYSIYPQVHSHRQTRAKSQSAGMLAVVVYFVVLVNTLADFLYAFWLDSDTFQEKLERLPAAWNVWNVWNVWYCVVLHYLVHT